jgi:hypothetical protein
MLLGSTWFNRILQGREEGERKLKQNPLGDSSMDTREMK